MTIVFDSVDITPLENANASLYAGLKTSSHTDLERDGVIQRFEYTFELSWKMIRKCLLAMGRSEVSASPKPLLRDAIREDFIEDLEIWFGFLDARNSIAHVYSESHAKKVFETATQFPSHVDKLVKQLKKYGRPYDE